MASAPNIFVLVLKRLCASQTVCLSLVPSLKFSKDRCSHQADTADLEFVDFSPELDGLHFLSPFNRANIGFVQAYYPLCRLYLLIELS